MLNEPEKRRFRRSLLAWFGRTARNLPWRRTRDPYRVWLSEIMLQQTQVATVVPYFTRFVAALPTIEDLAAAPEQTVLKLWEGLGYYRRARNLHRAARVIASQYGGRFPDDPGAALKLPGIGR
jgi:A/G-specific adenine glycosylase